MFPVDEVRVLKLQIKHLEERLQMVESFVSRRVFGGKVLYTNHARQRLMERYGFTLTHELECEFNRKIKDPRVAPDFYNEEKLCSYYSINAGNVDFFLVVYTDSIKPVVATFLTEQMYKRTLGAEMVHGNKSNK